MRSIFILGFEQINHASLGIFHRVELAVALRQFRFMEDLLPMSTWIKGFSIVYLRRFNTGKG
jgi:hypothetical protein